MQFIALVHREVLLMEPTVLTAQHLPELTLHIPDVSPTPVMGSIPFFSQMVHVEHVVMVRFLIQLEDPVPMHSLPIHKDNIIQMDIMVDHPLSEVKLKNQLS